MKVAKKLHKKFFQHGIEKIKREIGKDVSVLDLGCGWNSPLQYCGQRYSLGVDNFDDYLQISKNKSIHSQYMNADITEVVFEQGSFDVVLCAQVLEHLEKEEGERLLGKMEKWARKKIIITTPNGFMRKDACDGNEFQEHLSGWTADDLREKGFRVRGISGFRVITTRCKPTLFWRRGFDVSSKFTYFFPGSAFQLLAVKDLDQGKTPLH